MRISDWSSDVCSSDLLGTVGRQHAAERQQAPHRAEGIADPAVGGSDVRGAGPGPHVEDEGALEVVVVLAEGSPGNRVAPLATRIVRHDQRRTLDVETALVDATALRADHTYPAIHPVAGFLALALHRRRLVAVHSARWKALQQGTSW